MGKLTEKEKYEIKKLHRQLREKQACDKLKALLLLDKGYSYAEIEEILLIGNSSIYRWLKSFEENRDLEKYLQTNYSGYEGKLKDFQEEILVKHIETNLIRNVEIVRDFIEKTFDVAMKRSGVNAMIKRLGFSYKSTTGVYSKANLKEHKNFKQEYENLEAGLSSDQLLLCADSMHIPHNNKPSKAWIKTGSRAYIPTNSGRSNLNLHGVYCPHSKETFVKSYKVINQENIISFFKEVETLYPDKKDIFVVMDNARYYKGGEVQEYFKNSRIHPVFLPVGAPNLNLIERFWKFVIEHSIRHKFSSTFSDFKQDVLNFCNQSTLEFRRMLSQSVGTSLHLLPTHAYDL